MKRYVLAVLAALAVLWAVVAGADAAPVESSTGVVGPYNGSFTGIVYGDEGSRAPISLDLTHRGTQVRGKVSLGEGLYVDAGWCGEAYLPAVSQYVAGETSRWNARSLEVSPTFDLGGFNLTVDFESDVSRDGDTITAKAKADLPWFCGQDPVLTATAYRD